MSTQPDITEFLCTTLALACNREPETLSPLNSLSDINIDSLTLISVFAQFEAVYDVTLTEDDTLALLEALRIADLCERLARIASRR